MKRLVILFLAVALMLSAVVTAAAALGNTQEQLTHEETVLSGDPAAAEGLALSLRYSYREHLQWLSDYTMGDPQGSETAFRFHIGTPAYRYSETEYRGVTVNTMGDYFGVDTLSDLYRMESKNGSYGVYPGLLGAYRQLYDETPQGGLTNTYLRIRDYCEYYPLAGVMELPANAYHWNPYSSAGYLAGGEETAKVFNDYFRIPVLEDDWMQVVVDKRSGSVEEAVDVTESRKGSDVFRTSSVGICFEKTAYFTFSALTEQGNVVDTGLIPGGYGLYSFAYNDRGEPDLESLTTLCALDPAYAPYDMTVDEEHRNLLYISAKDGDRYLTVISLETMQILQNIRILEEEGLQWQFYKLLENGLVAVTEEAGISVWEKNDRGLFEHRFTSALEGTEGGHELYEAEYAFDGQRLAVVRRMENRIPIDPEDPRSEVSVQYCGFLVSVYTADGCAYRGSYSASPETGVYQRRSHYCNLVQMEPVWGQ